MFSNLALLPNGLVQREIREKSLTLHQASSTF